MKKFYILLAISVCFMTFNAHGMEDENLNKKRAPDNNHLTQEENLPDKENDDSDTINGAEKDPSAFWQGNLNQNKSEIREANSKKAKKKKT